LCEQGSAAFRELNSIQTEVDSLSAVVSGNAELVAKRRNAFQEADQRWARFVERPEVATAYEPVLTPLRLAIDVKGRELEEIVRRIDNHVLRAPIDGQATILAAQAGEPVEAGAPLVTIAPTSMSRVVAYLPESMLFSANVGTPVFVSYLAPAGGERRRHPGTVVSVSATVDEAPLRHRQNPTYPVWGRAVVVALHNDIRLVPGEAVTIALTDQH
jgi:multidrug efflux pump subunit AcrA (membrane-fusion protein)